MPLNSKKQYTREEIRRLLDGYRDIQRENFKSLPPGTFVRYFIKTNIEGKTDVIDLKMGGTVMSNKDHRFLIKLPGSKLPPYVLHYKKIYKLYYKNSATVENVFLRETLKTLEQRIIDLERKVKRIERKKNLHYITD